MADHRTIQLLCCELSCLKIGGYGRSQESANMIDTLREVLRAARFRMTRHKQ